MIPKTVGTNRRNTAFKHLMLLHWIMAAFALSLYITGIFVAHPPQSLLSRLIPFLHQSLGMLFLILLIARIFLLLRLIRHRQSRRSPKASTNERKSTILHGSLYFFMLIAPVSGFLLRNFTGLDTTFWGISVPPLFHPQPAWVMLAKSSHFWSSYLFLVFIFLHALVHWKMIRASIKRGFSTCRKRFLKKNHNSPVN